VLLAYYIPRETPYEAQVTFELFPGPLTRVGPLTVEISGTEGRVPTMKEAVVRRMLPFREGDIYREDLLFAGQRNLYNLDIFRSVGFLPDSFPAVDSILPVVIQVTEGDVRRVRTGGGLSNTECFSFEASWLNRNFSGGARRLQVTGRVSNVLANFVESPVLCQDTGPDKYGDLTGLISVDFTQPWFFSPRNSISVGLFAERQSIHPLFVRRAVGMNLGFTRTLAISTVLGFSYRPQRSKLTAAEVFFCSTYLICDGEEIKLLQEENRLAPVGISFSRDRRNQVLSPTQGYSTAVDLEYAGDWTGSQFRYTRVISDATWYTQGRKGWVVAARLRGGWVGRGGFRSHTQDGTSTEIVHPEKRLFAGGSNSVRGYSQNRLGPRVLYLERVEKLYEDGPCTAMEVADLSCDANGLPEDNFAPRPTGGTRMLEGSLELRIPLAGSFWESAAFLDFGQVWDESGNLSPADLEFTPGLGIRYFSPIGPIRVDLGYRFGSGEPLPVVTKAIGINPDGSTTELGNLVVLDMPVLWRDHLGVFDPRRFQLHLSIGQAF
ncbi:MAG: BamA/TamA family outer membrane protein, partial [Gemmatimonadota bacterium]